MVTQRYMLERRPPPSRGKLFLDQRVIPLAIDAAGSCEVALQRLSRRSGLNPVVLIGIGAGLLLSLLTLGRGSRRA